MIFEVLWSVGEVEILKGWGKGSVSANLKIPYHCCVRAFAKPESKFKLVNEGVPYTFKLSYGIKFRPYSNFMMLERAVQRHLSI